MLPRKTLLFIMVNRRRLGNRRVTAWSIDSDRGPEGNVKVLSSTLVMLYRTRSVFNVSSWGRLIWEFDLMRLTNSLASRSLKTVFVSAAGLMR
jgi:hypothetical protein